MANRFRLVEATLREELAKPYKYGIADCFMLGCRVVDALDEQAGLSERYRGAYSTLAGAQRALRRRGFESLSGLFESHLPRIAPAEAQTGDIAILALPDGEHVGVVAYSHVITKTERGRSNYPIGQAIAAFRTGSVEGRG